MVDRQLFSSQFYVNSIIGITAHLTPYTQDLSSQKLNNIQYTVLDIRHKLVV